jgi:hypothetical protein
VGSDGGDRLRRFRACAVVAAVAARDGAVFEVGEQSPAPAPARGGVAFDRGELRQLQLPARLQTTPWHGKLFQRDEFAAKPDAERLQVP